MIASPSTDLAASERRVAPRMQPAFRTICRLDRSGHAGLPAIGLVWNLSETGLSMFMADPPNPGAELSGELLPEEGGSGLPVNLRVVHVRPSSTGDFILGARFRNRLQPEAMKSFFVSSSSDGSHQTNEGSTNWIQPKKG